MGVVFLVLVILSVAIYGLGKLDQMTGSVAEAKPETKSIPATHGSDVSPEVIAVIGVALAMAQGESSASRVPGGAHNADSPGDPMPADWLSSGLSRQMASRSRESVRRNR